MQQGGVFKKGDRVLYRKDNTSEPMHADIADVHKDADPIFYTIKLADGKEKQTEGKYLLPSPKGGDSSSSDGKKARSYLTEELMSLDEKWSTLIEDQACHERAFLRLFEKLQLEIEKALEKFVNKFGEFSEETAERRSCFTKCSNLEHKQKLLQYQMDLIKAGKPFENGEDNTPRRRELTQKEAEVSTCFDLKQFNVGSEYLSHCISAADELIAAAKLDLRANLVRIRDEMLRTVETCHKKLDSDAVSAFQTLGVAANNESDSHEGFMKDSALGGAYSTNGVSNGGSVFTGGKVAESKEKRNVYVKLEQFIGRSQSLELVIKTLA